MNDKPVVLLVEDSQDDASEYKRVIEELINVTVIPVAPPPIEHLDLLQLVGQHGADAVILDEVLQTQSGAAYMGIDAMRYIRTAFPGLPVIILTDFPHRPELKRSGLLAENLWRKRDLSEDDRQYEDAVQDVRDLYERISRYRARRAQLETHPPPGETVTAEFVRRLAELHFETEDTIESIVWFKPDEEAQIHLLEVNRTALPTGRVQLFRFAPSEDVPFPIMIADVTPSEWEKIQSGDIPLPEGWDLDSMTLFGRPSDVPGGDADVV